MPYQWILFDADNTLLDFDKAEQFALHAALLEAGFDTSEEQLAQYHVINRECWRAYEAGKLAKDRLRHLRFERLLECMGVAKDEALGHAVRIADSYMLRLAESDHLVHEAMELLESLHQRVGMAMVTNGLAEVQWPRVDKTGLRRFFPTIVISDEIGVSKPNAGFFEHTFQLLDHPERSEVLMVGDNLVADIGGAQNFGLDTCWFNPRGLPNSSGYTPTFEIRRLSQIPGLMGSGF